jgi:hypothetical protein
LFKDLPSSWPVRNPFESLAPRNITNGKPDFDILASFFVAECVRQA